MIETDFSNLKSSQKDVFIDTSWETQKIGPDQVPKELFLYPMVRTLRISSKKSSEPNLKKPICQKMIFPQLPKTDLKSAR